MSSMSKILAGVLLAAGLVLAFLAWRLAVRPAPVAAVAEVRVAPQEVARAPVASERFPVVVAAATLEAGTKLDSATMLAVAQWPVALEGGYAKTDALQGAVTRVAISAGQPLLQPMLAHGLATQLQAGERAVAISVDEVIGAANRIVPGDMVDVFFTLEKGNEVQAGQARLLQPRVRVLAYGGQSIDGPSNEEKAAQKNGMNQTPRTAVLAVGVEQVNELLLATRAGRLQLALRPAGDTDVPDSSLFATRATVLPGRVDLSQEQRLALQNGNNRAFAGDSLLQLEQPKPVRETAASPARSSGGRTVEVLRGSQSERVRY